MKKKILVFIAFCLVGIKGFSQMLTFDLENWLKSIDQLYASYDMVQNTITQIENQYKQIQMAINNAKNIDWNNVRFDGDFDIRNDINNAGKRVNRLLSSVSSIKESISTPSINFGYGSYSIADLCGVNGNGKNIIAATKDTANYMSDNMKAVITTMTNKMTPEQKAEIMSKYGISAENYMLVQQSTKLISEKVQNLMGKCTDEARKALIEENVGASSNVINAVYQTLDEYGNIPEGASREATLLLINNMIEALTKLNMDINEANSLNALKEINEAAEKESKDSANEKLMKQNYLYDSTKFEAWAGIVDE